MTVLISMKELLTILNEGSVPTFLYTTEKSPLVCMNHGAALDTILK
jgi:hypothetical protein